MKAKLWIAVAVLLVSFCLPAAGEDPPREYTTLSDWTHLTARAADGSVPIHYVVPVGQLGGSTQRVAVQGTRAYVGQGPRMLVLDVTAPAAPVLLGQTAPLPALVNWVTVVGDLVYVTLEHAGLHIFDVSDPAAPVEIGAYDTPGAAQMVAVSGTLAFVAEDWTGLQVIDVADPAHPSLLATLDTPGSATGVIVAGTLAYVSDLDGGLRIVDVSDPEHPVEIGSYDTPGDAWNLDVAGNTAYVADNQCGLRVIDVSDPAHPVEIGAYTALNIVVGVAVRGTTAYLADWWSGLHMIDVSDPAAPYELGAYDTPAYALNVAVQGGPSGVTAYVADGDGGLRIIDVTDPAHPVEVGYHSPLGHGLNTAVAGSLVYVAGGFSGLRVVDAGDPEQPHQIGEYATPEGCADVAVVGNTAFIVTVYGGLHILDVADPTAPALLGFVPGGGNSVAVLGHMAYTVSADGLRVIDVTQPANPVQAGFCPVPGAWTVAVRGTIAYVAAGQSGLALIDVSDPQHPQLLSLSDTPGDARTVAVAGRFAYVANCFGYDGVRVIDISDPRNPVEYPPIAVPGGLTGVQVGMLRGDGSPRVLYVAQGGGGPGLAVVDLVDPAHPILASYDTAGDGELVNVVGSLAYFADRAGGLCLLRLLRDRQEATTTKQGGSVVAGDGSLVASFPAGAFTDAVTVTYERLPADEHKGSLVGIGHTFDLSAAYSATGKTAQVVPGQSYVVTLHYTDAELGRARESSLAFYAWDGNGWVREPSSVLDASANTLTATLDHLGMFAVLGELGPLPGDVDGDCDVDIVDIMLVASRWGAVAGQAKYDPRYDLDADGDIDVVDIMRVAAHWFETCS